MAKRSLSMIRALMRLPHIAWHLGRGGGGGVGELEGKRAEFPEPDLNLDAPSSLKKKNNTS